MRRALIVVFCISVLALVVSAALQSKSKPEKPIDFQIMKCGESQDNKELGKQCLMLKQPPVHAEKFLRSIKPKTRRAYAILHDPHAHPIPFPRELIARRRVRS